MKKIFIVILCLTAAVNAPAYDKLTVTESLLAGSIILSGMHAPLLTYAHFTDWVSNERSLPSLDTLKGVGLANIAALSAGLSLDGFKYLYHNPQERKLWFLTRPFISSAICYITSKIASDRYNVSFLNSLPMALWMTSVFYHSYHTVQPGFTIELL